jgi:DNA polymerase III alpha subunit
VERELAVIRERHWAPWFEAAKRVARSARESGIVLRPDISTWTASLVAFALGISGVDPVAWDAPFERMADRSAALSEIEVGISKSAAPRLVDTIRRQVPVQVDVRREDPGPYAGLSLRFPGEGAPAELSLAFVPALDDVQVAVVANGLDLEAIDLDDAAPLLGVKPKPPTKGGQALLESEYANWFINRIRPSNFEQLMACVVLTMDRSWLDEGRDGLTEECWRKYFSRRHGYKKPVYPHPACEPYLSRTFGLLLYQEQAMAIARGIAGFTMGEANELRLALITKHRKPTLYADCRDRFIDGALLAGLAREEARGVFDYLDGFSLLATSRAHVAGDALLCLWDAHAAR